MYKNELSAAIAAAEAKFGYRLSYDFARSAVQKVSDKYRRLSFPEALRYGLNELHCDPRKRAGYAKVVGIVLGKRGGRKAAQRRAKPIPARQEKEKPSTIGQITEEAHGQFAFTL